MACLAALRYRDDSTQQQLPTVVYGNVPRNTHRHARTQHTHTHTVYRVCASSRKTGVILQNYFAGKPNESVDLKGASHLFSSWAVAEEHASTSCTLTHIGHPVIRRPEAPPSNTEIPPPAGEGTQQQSASRLPRIRHTCLVRRKHLHNAGCEIQRHDMTHSASAARPSIRALSIISVFIPIQPAAALLIFRPPASAALNDFHL